MPNSRRQREIGDPSGPALKLPNLPDVRALSPDLTRSRYGFKQGTANRRLGKAGCFVLSVCSRAHRH